MDFKDVKKEHWAYEAIKEISDLGYMQGNPDGTFKPDEPVTRAEVAAILQRLK